MMFMRHTKALKGMAVIAAVLLAAGIYLYISTTPIEQQTAESEAALVGQMRFEVANTEAKQAQGLSNRSSIPDDYGMLFVFPKKDRYGFWMKDMLVPIDIIWLDDEGNIILIDHTVEPSTYPNSFFPPVPVKYVLETRAGYAREHAWDVGTHVELPSPYGK